MSFQTEHIKRYYTKYVKRLDSSSFVEGGLAAIWAYLRKYYSVNFENVLLRHLSY